MTEATINREIAEGLGSATFPDYINSAEASAALEDELDRRKYVVRTSARGHGSEESRCYICIHVEGLTEKGIQWDGVPITTSASAARRLALAMCAAKVLKKK